MSKETVAVFCVLAGLIYYLMPRESDYTQGSTGGGSAVVITPANFDAEVIQSATPVLAYFWAPW